MNSLSWLLYLAGVLGNFAGLAIWLGVGIAIASGISYGDWVVKHVKSEYKSLVQAKGQYQFELDNS